MAADEVAKAHLERFRPEEKPAAVYSPDHYNWHPSGIECIQITEHMNFNVGNAFKYLFRQGRKGQDTAIQDLEKARWYIDREIKRVQEGTDSSDS